MISAELFISSGFAHIAICTMNNTGHHTENRDPGPMINGKKEWKVTSGCDTLPHWVVRGEMWYLSAE